MTRFTIFLITLLLSFDIFADSLNLVDPWIRQAPPTAKNLAGYVELSNPGNNPVTIVKVESPMFSRVELHVTTL